MALRDVTNREPKNYVPQVQMAPKYAPVIRRGKPLEGQADRASFPARRAAGENHIDLWVDGKVYPDDPASNCPPKFETIKEYLEFLCEGESGMLGYTKRLKVEGNRRYSTTNVDLLERCVADLQSRVITYENDIYCLQYGCQGLQNELISCTELYMKERVDFRTALRVSIAAHTLERENLQEAVRALESTCNDLMVEACALNTKDKQHIEKVQVLEAEIVRCKGDFEMLEKKMKSMVRTPLGFRQRVHEKIKSFDELSSGLGYAKRRRTILRAQLQPSIVGLAQRCNREGRLRKRFMGDALTENKTAAALGSILSKGEASALLDQPKMKEATSQIVKKVLKKIGESIGPDAILAACDGSGVLQRGYGAIYRTINNQIGLVVPGLRAKVLPAPGRLSGLRKEMNAKLPQFIGDYYHVEGRRVIQAVRRGRKELAVAKEVILNSKNNLFVDLKVVQHSMVLFYAMTIEECDGKPLVFVLKLDEVEIQQGKKLERVSLTLMNRALDPEIQKDDDRYFSVQSEQEIWPIACFQVGKESFDILNWVFKKTKFPEFIAAQTNGQQLVVDNVGEFDVEWHLSADMKTIKCMNGLQHGPNSKMYCIYCEQVREKPKVVNAATVTVAAAARTSGEWQGGLFATNIDAEPCDTSTHPRWNSILSIPLSRTHICTLHAQVKMIEKILHMHLMHVWTMLDLERRAVCIELMEKSLSAIGLDGGNFQLKKDPKLSGATGNVVQKLSLSGVVASRLFQPSLWSNQNRAWKDVCMSEQNNLENGAARLKRHRLWEALEKLLPYLNGLVLSPLERQACKGIIKAFGDAFLAAFGKTQVTHYMMGQHVVVKHGPWFVERYGSLSVWSCQGMEKSHHAAKVANQAHTQHGGTAARTSVIVQQYEHWYRNIQHRYTRRIEAENARATRSLEDTSAAASKERRRVAWQMSSAATSHCEWRVGRIRQGSRWVLRQDTTSGTNQENMSQESL